eukprot:1161843-Pelagomonas_calceolata.AAC.12
MIQLGACLISPSFTASPQCAVGTCVVKSVPVPVFLLHCCHCQHRDYYRTFKPDGQGLAMLVCNEPASSVPEMCIGSNSKSES